MSAIEFLATARPVVLTAVGVSRRHRRLNGHPTLGVQVPMLYPEQALLVRIQRTDPPAG
jgi:hypothetical protein